MIQTQTLLRVVDNSKARYAQCIKIFKGKKARIGDTILVVVKNVKASKRKEKTKIKKGQICRAILIRSKTAHQRKNGTILRFSQNGVLLLNNKGKPIASRVFGPTIEEQRRLKNFKIVSLVSYLV